MTKGDALQRVSASKAVATLRAYVTDYINRGDFSILGDLMTLDYTLDTGGVLIAGRDGAYRAAVAKQLKQFPGLTFTPHQVLHCGDRIAVRFTEHGASLSHDGAEAAWPSIAIYTLRDGKLARCAIEQDYFSRRRQLAARVPVAVDPPAIAPWDTLEQAADPTAEALVGEWLADAAWSSARNVRVDDAHTTGATEHVINQAAITVCEIMSCAEWVAFHAVQRGGVRAEFVTAAAARCEGFMHVSGIVRVAGGDVVEGFVIRDRWGLYRRLSPGAAHA